MSARVVHAAAEVQADDRVREQLRSDEVGYCITTDGWTAGDVTTHRYASDRPAGSVTMRTTMGAAAVQSRDAILPGRTGAAE